MIFVEFLLYLFEIVFIGTIEMLIQIVFNYKVINERVAKRGSYKNRNIANKRDILIK